MRNKLTLTEILGEFILYFIIIGLIFGFAIAGLVLTVIYLITK